ncbi:MAG: hypothetical protein WDM92_10020 [Caulobacteraceae bacterium]
MSDAHDPETLAFYDREAEVYAARFDAAYHARLDGFIDRLPHGARVLELGAGGGRDAAAMIARGLDVELTDGSVGLARQAEAKLGRPVRIMLFHELDAEAAYDGVWANASLLHAKGEALPRHLRPRIPRPEAGRPVLRQLQGRRRRRPRQPRPLLQLPDGARPPRLAGGRRAVGLHRYRDRPGRRLRRRPAHGAACVVR